MFNENANKLRRLMAEKDLVIGVGARDGLEAKLVENAGFDFVWSSSLGVSASYAIPDASLISMKQYIEAARSMAEVIDIPIISDADTGYGNANNVMYAVKQFEAAGLAAMSIEDKKFPKDNSLLAGGRQELVRIEEFCGKIRAAKDTHNLTGGYLQTSGQTTGAMTFVFMLDQFSFACYHWLMRIFAAQGLYGSLLIHRKYYFTVS